MPDEPKENVLYYGDNLDILRRYIENESVDLVYLDPPFKSQQDYNVLFAERDGTQAAAQIKAFEDTWQWDQSAAAAYESVVTLGGKVSDAMCALYKFLGPSDMMAYLAMMAPRLVELRRILKPTGSIYLHCDPTASHYLKMLMDAIFGPENFRNEIIWRRTGSNNSANRFGPIHQTIHYYVKSETSPFYVQTGPYTKGYVNDYFRYEDERGRYRPVLLTGPGIRTGESGKPWRSYDPTSSGRHWAFPEYLEKKVFTISGESVGEMTLIQKLEKCDSVGLIHWGKDAKVPNYKFYLEDAPGVPYQDLWTYQPGTEGCVYGNEKIGIDTDVKWLTTQDGERLGYPTQKPEGLLERIIQASCPEGGLVLDPFCGCGTTIAVAERLHRQWIGIDITHLAISLMRHRLDDAFGGEAKYKVIGEPVSLPDAEDLAQADPYQFQWWALGLVGARPSEGKKGADKGIDGRSMFFVEKGVPEQIIYSVKAGHVTSSHVRDLNGVLQREKAAIGVLISLNEPTKQMRTEAASMAPYISKELGNPRYPKIQLLTIEELLDGKRVQAPHSVHSVERNVTFRKAPVAKKKKKEDKKQSKLI